LQQWGSLPEDDTGEWVDGYLVEEEMPNLDHETIAGRIFFCLASWLFPRGGLLYGAGVKYALPIRRGRIPDLSAFLPGRPRPRRGNLVDIPPDIMIEIVSPTPNDPKRDRVEKLREYALFSVPYYWLVDPQVRSFEICELGADGRYVIAVSAAEGTVDIPGCEGLTLDLDALWAQLDALDS